MTVYLNSKRPASRLCSEKKLMFTTHFINFVRTFFGEYHSGVDKLKDSKSISQKSIQVQACVNSYEMLDSLFVL